MKKIIETVFGRKHFLSITLPIILIIALIIVAFFSWQKPKTITLTPDQAKTKAETFIDKFLMQGGNKAVIKNISTEYGLYKLKINIVNSTVNSYLTKDGKLFFPQALNIDEITNKATAKKPTANTPTPSTKVATKNAKPNVDLFVMSYCPYGTQIEKGILPVLATLGNKINFQLKFVDYSMHGPKELAENMTQYCIIKDAPQKLDSYLSCFLKSGDSDSCLNTNNINKKQISACTSATDQQYKITANAKNHINYNGSYPSFPIDQAGNQKYKVLGSPTLVINGQQINSGRDSASLLKAICSAFKTQPKECKTVLSTISPAPGIGTASNSGTATTPSNSGASCGG